MTGVTTNSIVEGLMVASCISVSRIFQDYKKDNIELIIERVLHIVGLPIQLISPQQFTKQTGYIGDGLHAENNEAHLIFGGFRFTKKNDANSGLPIYNYINRISKFRAYNIELHRDGGKQIISLWHNDLF